MKQRGNISEKQTIPTAIAAWRLAALMTSAVVVANGCGSQNSDSPTDVLAGQNYELHAFADCAELDRYITDSVTDMFVRSYTQGDYFAGGIPVTDVGENLVGAPIESGGGAGEPADFTTTNVQEAGVDEPDLLKTDGQHSYYLLNSVLHIIDSWPAEEASEVGRMPLDGWGEEMFLVDDTVVTFMSVADGVDDCDFGPCPLQPGPSAAHDARRANAEPSDSMPSPQPFIGVRVTVIDVSNPAAPSVRRSLDIEGALVSARLVDGIVYLVTSRHPHYDPVLLDRLAAAGLTDPPALRGEDADRAAADVRDRVRPIIADYVENGGRAGFLPDLRTQDRRQDLLPCSRVMRPERRSDLTMLSVVAIDRAIDRAPSGTGLLASGFHVYGSQTSLYVAQDSRWWWWPRDARRFAETDVHQFALNAGDPVYRASGAVPGWIIGQFSMSEYADHLRIATTDQSFGAWWWPPLEDDDDESGVADRDANNVFVLHREGNELQAVGEARGIAPGERIFAVRFLGERGYVVTFEQIDPLFTIDLSDPRNPRVVGELELTGFSTYLHPFGEQYLIGVGRGGTDTGRILGLQLQLFDVSDAAQPIRIHQSLLAEGARGWSSSEAEHDHHAFTFYARDNLLALPVTLDTVGSGRDEYNHFSGVIVYEVSVAQGFVELGRISHSGLRGGRYCPDDDSWVPGSDATCFVIAPDWFARMRRAAFIDDYLFAFSNLGVTVSHNNDLDTPVSTIPLP
jgi:uncharacterized secreted protein with C-terminal beta-propeller domain